MSVFARRGFISAAVAVGVVGGGGELRAAPIQWTAGSGGNDHYYVRVEQSGITYDQAVTAAAAMSFNGLAGHLAILDTSDYTAERDFVFNNVYSPGVTSSRAYWVGATLPVSGSTWTWLDGLTVPSTVSNTWNVDHNEGNVREGATFFQTTSDTIWDYDAANSGSLSSGFIVEFQAVPEPASLGVLLCGGAVLLVKRRRG